MREWSRTPPPQVTEQADPFDHSDQPPLTEKVRVQSGSAQVGMYMYSSCTRGQSVLSYFLCGVQHVVFINSPHLFSHNTVRFPQIAGEEILVNWAVAQADAY